MKLRMLTAAAVLSLSFAGAAYADGKVSATLKTPVPAKTRVMASGAVFYCEGTSCVASSTQPRTASTAGCKGLVKEVGEVTAFGTAQKAISAEDLAACNSVASK